MKKILKLFRKLGIKKPKTDILKPKSPPFKKRMKHLERYFKRQIEKNKLFEPEYIAIKKINEYALKEKLLKEDLIKIVEVFNKTNSEHHHNGSGWFDLRLHIQGLIKANGFEYQTNKSEEIVLK